MTALRSYCGFPDRVSVSDSDTASPSAKDPKKGARALMRPRFSFSEARCRIGTKSTC
jgi:hypothetical protein